MNRNNRVDYAKAMDSEDKLASFRNEFYIPMLHGKDAIYFCGNSLGLQPKTVQDAVLNELEDWANFGVEGYAHSRNEWMNWSNKFPELLKDIVGGLPHEIVVMNQLTMNLHLMMATFFRPQNKRKKVIIESKAFPSDEYVIASQLQLAGLSKENELVEVKARHGEQVLREDDILNAIEATGEELALVLIGGVNYYTGQVFDIERITKASHQVGALCGFDLAHAVGNIELKLHDWDVDFACWCSYKYLNSGPGAVGGVFIHERHTSNPELPRLQGWWGVDENVKFQMKKDFLPAQGAAGWQLSTAPFLSLAIHQSSLEIFQKAGFENVLEKGKALSGYLVYLLNEILDSSSNPSFEIITPLNEKGHGCQISILMKENGKHQFDMLRKNGVIADWREPNVIRLAPAPLYNTFEEVFTFAKILEHIVKGH